MYGNCASGEIQYRGILKKYGIISEKNPLSNIFCHLHASLPGSQAPGRCSACWSRLPAAAPELEAGRSAPGVAGRSAGAAEVAGRSAGAVVEAAGRSVEGLEEADSRW